MLYIASKLSVTFQHDTYIICESDPVESWYEKKGVYQVELVVKWRVNII